MTALGPGRVSGRAVVDLDAVRKAKNPTSLLDPMNYLFGRLPVTATGMLTTSNGVGRFELESASVGSMPIPKMFLQEIISHYSRTRREPGGPQPRRSVSTAGAHPRDPGGAGPSHNRAMNADEVLATPLQFLKGVGPRRAADLEHAGLITLEDLLYRFPIRYEDRSRLQPIASLKPGQTRVDRRPRARVRAALDAASRVQDLRGGDRRRHRLAARGVAEPAVSARRLRARPARRAVRRRSRCAARSACS